MNKKKIKAGYLYTRNNEITDRPFEVLDIVYHSFMMLSGINGNNNLDPEEKFMKNLVEEILPRAKRNNTKVLLSINNGFALPRAIREYDEEEIDFFVMGLINFMEEYEFDGYDISIEAFTRGLIPNFIYFVNKFSQELHLKGKLLTGTFRAGNSGLPYFGDKDLHEAFDYVNIMTYHMDSKEYYYHSALHRMIGKTTKGCSWDEALALYDEWCPREKLNLGFATFVQHQGRVVANQSEIDHFEEEFIFYDEDCEVAYYEKTEDDVYLDFAQFENERSLNAKLDFIEEEDLAGIFYWEYGFDDERLLEVLADRNWTEEKE